MAYSNNVTISVVCRKKEGNYFVNFPGVKECPFKLKPGTEFYLLVTATNNDRSKKAKVKVSISVDGVTPKINETFEKEIDPGKAVMLKAWKIKMGTIPIEVHAKGWLYY